MPEITEIRRVARGSKRRRIYVDGYEWKSLPAEVVRELGLREGQQQDVDALAHRVFEVAPALAWERALRLLNYRERGSAELSERLIDDGYDAQVAQDIVRRAVDLGFVDDRRFAEGVVRALTQGRRQGRRRVAQTLAAKGVDESLAADLMERCCDPGSEHERATGIARRLIATRPIEARKLAARLASRGFDASVAWEVAREVSESSGDLPEGG